MRRALQGYRVLAIDFDPQATLSHSMGLTDVAEEHTVWGVMVRDLVRETQRLNAAASGAESGRQVAPRTLPASIRDLGLEDLRTDDFIAPTCWPTIDMIPSCANAAFVEFASAQYRHLVPDWSFFACVARYLDALPDDAYDIVIFDCPPAIGYQSMNAVFAADVLYIPSGPGYWEYDSTTSFIGQLAEALEDLAAGFGETFPTGKITGSTPTAQGVPCDPLPVDPLRARERAAPRDARRIPQRLRRPCYNQPDRNDAGGRTVRPVPEFGLRDRLSRDDPRHLEAGQAILRPGLRGVRTDGAPGLGRNGERGGSRMSKRRRMFEIEVPAGEPGRATPSPVLETKTQQQPRRGPMAAAMREAAEASRARTETEAAVRAENDRLAHEHVRLKRLGLIVDLVEVDRIDTAKLRRDRSAGEDDELDDLVASIREIGLSNPIRVEQAGERYELIQGWRRLQAYRALLDETDDERWARIPAGMVAPGDDLVTSYRRMVDENLIRKDISFAEMATLARDYAADPEVPCRDVGSAVAELYASAGYQKRSYIRAFAELLDMLEADLQHPEAIPRNLGLEVRRQLAEGRPGLADLQAALRSRPNRTTDTELSILRGFVGAAGQGAETALAEDLPHGEESAPPSSAARKAKTTFRLPASGGEIRCSASDGRLVLQGETDFSGYDRRRLEAAVQAFLAALDGE